MTQFVWLWIPFTLLAAAGQVVRNALQRGLTAQLGTLGATHIRVGSAIFGARDYG